MIGEATYSDESYDAALNIIATTDIKSIKAWKVDGLPNLDTMRARAKRNPALKVRIADALAQRNARLGQRARRSYSNFECEKSLRVLEGHPDKTQAEVDQLLETMDLPLMQTVWVRSKTDANLSTMFKHANQIRGIIQFTESAFTAALDQLRSNLLADFEYLLPHGNPEVASFTAVRDRVDSKRQRHALFLEEYRVVMLRRATARRSVNAPKVYAEHVLLSGLMLDELYREASKLFSQAYPDREDMISEVVLAVWDRRITRDEIVTKGRAIGLKYINSLTNAKTLTLDDTVSGGEEERMLWVDTMTTDEWCGEDAI